MIIDDLGLSRNDRDKLEKILVDFDHSWSTNSFDKVAADLVLVSDDFSRVAISELIKIDLHRNWDRGKKRRVDFYSSALESIGIGPDIPAQLILSEYLARHSAGEAPSSNEYQRRFPAQFAEFKRLLDIEKAKRSGLDHVQASINTDHGTSFTRTRPEGSGDSQTLPETFGRYKILRRLGAGAMGAVYLANDTQLDRHVALKTPNFGGEISCELVERFYREARAAAILRHEYICAVFDVGEIDGRHYITMDYIEGRPLSDYIGGAKPLEQKAVASLIRKLAFALQHAHEESIIHRDLKPDNVMVDEKRQPLVMDFGLARRDDEMQSRMTQSGTILGTPAYMSPEQVKGQFDRIGPQADVYSLGVILYELLTGKLPFEGSVAAVIGQILTQEPPPPSKLRSDIDPSLETICLKMIAKEQSDRYASMKNVAGDLAEYIKGTHPQVDAVPPMPGAVDPFEGLPLAKLVEEPVAIQPAQSARVSPLRKSASTPKTSLSFWKTRNGRYAMIGAALVGLALMVWSVTLIFRTPYGTLTITIDDPDIAVEVDGKQITIRDDAPIRLKNGSHQLALRIGDQRLPIGESEPFQIVGREGKFRLSANYGDTELSSHQFTIDKGKNRALTIALIPIEDIAPAPVKLATNDRPIETPKVTYDGVATGTWIPVLEVSPPNEGEKVIYRDGVLRLDRILLVKPDFVGRDMIVRTRLKKLSGQHGSFKLRCNSNANTYTIWMNNPNLIGIGKTIGGKYKDIKVVTPQDVKLDEQGCVELACAMVGSRLRVFLNGQMIIDLVDESLSEGYPAFFAMKGVSEYKDIELMFLDASTPTDILTSDQWKWTEPALLGAPLDEPESDNIGVVFHHASAAVCFASNRAGGSGGYDLWAAWQAEDPGTYKDLNPLRSTVNSPHDEISMRFPTPGWQQIIFQRNEPDNISSADLWFGTRKSASKDSFDNCEKLPSPINSIDFDGMPELSTNGLTMIFASKRPGSNGGSDLWITSRPDKNEPFAEPRNLGQGINSQHNEAWPNLSSDGCSLIFQRFSEPFESIESSIDAPSGTLWTATRLTTKDPFGNPVKLDPVINNGENVSCGALSTNGRMLIFNRNKRLWVTHRIPLDQENQIAETDRSQNNINKSQNLIDSKHAPDLVVQIPHDAQNNFQCHDATISPDGRYVLYSIGQQSKLQMFDVNSETNVQLPIRDATGVVSIDWAMDSTHFVTGSLDGEIAFWNAEERNVDRTFKPSISGAVRWVFLSRDGDRLLSLTLPDQKGHDAVVDVWNFETAELIQSISTRVGHAKLAAKKCIAASPDGKWLVISRGRQKVTWDTTSGRKIGNVPLPLGNATPVAFSADSPYLAARGSADGKNSMLNVYDMDSKNNIGPFALDAPIAIALSADGSSLAGATLAGRRPDTDRIFLFETLTQKTRLAFRPPYYDVRIDYGGPWIKFLSFSQDGRLLLSAGFNSPVCVWRLDASDLPDSKLADIDDPGEADAATITPKNRNQRRAAPDKRLRAANADKQTSGLRGSLKFKNVPASRILKFGLLANLKYEYDEKVLNEAGIDLDRRIDIDVKGSREELLRAILDTLELDFRINGETVTLVPKAKR